MVRLETAASNIITLVRCTCETEQIGFHFTEISDS